MSLGPVDAANMQGDERSHPGLDLLFRHLSDVIVHSLAPADGTGPVLSVVPLRAGTRFLPGPVGDGATVRLAPGVVPIRRGGVLTLTCPRGWYCVELLRAPATLVPEALRDPVPAAAPVREIDPGASSLVPEILAHLVGAGVAISARTHARSADGCDSQPHSAAGD